MSVVVKQERLLNRAVGHKKLVRIIYIDESEATGKRLDDPNAPYHIVTAVIVHGDEQWGPLDELKRVLGEILRPDEDPHSFEIHASKIFHAQGEFRGISRDLRMTGIHVMLDFIRQLALPIVYGAVNKPRLGGPLKQWTPHELAFIFCVERVQRWFSANAPNEKGMLISDRIDRKVSSLKKLVEEGRRKGFPLGIRQEKLDNIVDALYFVDSDETVGIQVADLCAFVIQRHLNQKPDPWDFYECIKENIAYRRVFP